MYQIRVKIDTMSAATPETKAAYDAYLEKKKEAEAALKNFFEVYRATPVYEALLALINGKEYSIQTAWDFSEAGMTADTGHHNYRRSFDISRVHDSNAGGYVDPKTLNLLLSGRLLTDDQKRKLLARMNIFDFDAGDTAE
ncbi:hypothetical protein [uncultured Hyphomonas sp.]|uniref:hypothetical protein n=1 Tax=uncultured Hyphomonas sp. TaxID=225298 RepID=UPI000C3F63D6|nr:hypothetical protein [Hyphomonadaceae bacterium]MBA30124.1 hypothetical protein [Hyphomonadaceae bacterium]QDP63689.1 MAG: hypothetical protein GOVbin258_17 [Prokaryotic dsDNA virus sp.]|tara:strand:+ start:39058 stop:39477 length:420 start_codon:yes stop_codon:yes gene_type:complete